MTAAEAVARLFGLARFEQAGMRPGLERIEAVLAALGHPEADLPVVHVGGTNGKGSVSALTEAILRAAGLRTGLYTSPHLLDVTERIRIAGVPIARDDFGRLAARLAPWLQAGSLTFFEAVTALAFLAFREAGVEAAILEVGMGGRWDATNVGPAGVAVITRVDYDHQQFLGWHLADIAAEKAAIVRGGVALSAAQAPEALDVVEARCRAVGVPLFVEGRDIRTEVVGSDLRGHRVRFAWTGPGGAGALTDVELALPGLYQPPNAALAVGAARTFATTTGRNVPDAAVRAGCAGIRWPGRFQVVPGGPGRPLIVLDGAHNPGGAHALAASLRHYFPGAALALILGISADKDRAGILKALAPVATRLYFTAASNPRAAAPADLAGELPPFEGRVTTAPDVATALRAALAERGNDVVCVGGSLFLVADALRWLGEAGLVDRA
ncbi:MAG: bifunctional folylpolyglutamate synthase/dihydrofolate synthase [Candidatus Rokuibacteriota bacterium]|nr:MAG: bifunctional folylpolyglutamate synthase/dihydrofolate synthase [Candidatus Rokubacteria bacterium]